MKRSLLSFGLVLLSALALRADLVVVQAVEGIGHSGQMTLKIKDDKMRMDVTPEMSTLTDMGTGPPRLLLKRHCPAQFDGNLSQLVVDEHFDGIPPRRVDDLEGQVRFAVRQGNGP